MSKINNLVSEDLYNFINKELLKGTSITSDYFWQGFKQCEP